MRWDVRPFVGLGPIAFGMTEAEVASVALPMAAVRARGVDATGIITEHRGLEDPSISYQNGKVAYIAIGSRTANVEWAGLDIFQQEAEAVLRSLESAGGGAEVGLGTISFAALGIDTNAFYFPKTKKFFKFSSSEQDDRTISMYDRELYHEIRKNLSSHFRPISFLRKDGY
jgi:hypothetical protein